MKKTLLTIALFCISIYGIAQTKFTESDFKAMNGRYLKNPVAFIQNETMPNFIYTGTDGIPHVKSSTIELYGILDDISREYSGIKIYQNGSNAVVTSFLKHAVLIKPTGQKRIENETLTATMINKNGKWMLQSATHSFAPTDINANEAAIKKVIQDETNAFYEGDAEKSINAWSGKASDEYQRQYLISYVGNSYAKGEGMLKMQDLMRKYAKKQEVDITDTDFEIRQNGNMAWATYTQEVKEGGQIKQKQRETRILERINGEWKIVFVSGQEVK